MPCAQGLTGPSGKSSPDHPFHSSSLLQARPSVVPSATPQRRRMGIYRIYPVRPISKSEPTKFFSRLEGGRTLPVCRKRFHDYATPTSWPEMGSHVRPRCTRP
jgi:hypothetical protein